MKWFTQALQRYADFSGRARRKEYWIFLLIAYAIGIALYAGGVLLLIPLKANGADSGGVAILAVAPAILYFLAMILPGLAVTVRRLHDIGKSGWWYLISLVPFVGGIILFVFTCLDSEAYPNEWGPDPKEGERLPAFMQR